MPAFDIALMSPIGSGFTHSLGGPNSGGHQLPDWFIQFGMDLGAPAGTEVRASFDGHISKFFPHDPAQDSGKVYGAQIFARDPSDRMGCFYTHLTDTPASFAPGAEISRGELIGRVLEFGGIPGHVHMAVCEIFGDVASGARVGVDLNELYVALSGTDHSAVVTFAQQQGIPPQTGGVAPPSTIGLTGLRGIQQGLALLGFDPQGIDGVDGPNTQAAVRAFQASEGLEATGQADDATVAALAAALEGQGMTATGIGQ